MSAKFNTVLAFPGWGMAYPLWNVVPGKSGGRYFCSASIYVSSSTTVGSANARRSASTADSISGSSLGTTFNRPSSLPNANHNFANSR